MLCQKLKKHYQKPAQDLSFLCAQPRAEDGIPPHLLKKQHFREERDAHSLNGLQARQRQYCKAAQRALEAGLASVCGDDRLKDLAILSVEPANRSGSTLLVVAAAAVTHSAETAVLEHVLQKAAGLLRSVIASEIHRKRTPHLTFRVVPEQTRQIPE